MGFWNGVKIVVGGIIFSIILIIILILVFVFGLIAIDQIFDMTLLDDSEYWLGQLPRNQHAMLLLMIGFGAPLIMIPVTYKFMKRGQHCSRCDANWSLKAAGTEVISQTPRIEIKTRSDGKYKVHYDEEVYWQYYECKKCRDTTRVQCTHRINEGEYRVE